MAERDVKEEIKAQVVPSEYIRRDVPDLRDVGHGMWRGTCGIHPGTNPTELAVNDTEKFWRCFSCGEGGDIIKWVMLREGIEFNEALKTLAEYAGIDIPKKKSKTEKAAERRYKVYTTMGEILRFWGRGLDDTIFGHIQAIYGITWETVESFRIGYAGGDLLAYLKEKGITDDEAKATGLIIEDSKGNLVVPMLGRIIFPWVVEGELVYVSGRRIGTPWDEHPKKLAKYRTPSPTGRDDVEPPKYAQQALHTSARKYVDGCIKRPLWGCDSLGDAAHVFIAEGIPDVYMAWQHREALGDEWAVISSGSVSFRKQDFDLVRKRAPNADITICFDDDESGIDGALKIGAEFLRRQATVRVATIGQGEETDLAIFLRDGGSLEELVEKAQDLIEFWVFHLKKQEGDVGEKKLYAEVFPVVAYLEGSALESTISLISGAFGIPLATVRDEVDKSGRKKEEVGDVQKKATAVFQKHFQVIGHNRTEQRTDLVVWSRKHGTLVYLPMTAMSKVAGIIAPEVNIHDAIGEATGVKDTSALLRDAMHYLTASSVPLGSFTKIKSGLHVVGDKIIIISGSQIIVKEQGQPWEKIHDPFVAEGYVAECGDIENDWLEFSVEELNEPLSPNYTPKRVYEILADIVAKGWKFKHPNDAKILAAVIYAMTWSTIFPRRSLVHIRGPAGSGKTTLVFGLFGGGLSYQRMGGPFIGTARCEEDASYAGIVSRYGHSGHVLLLDEGELKATPTSKQERNVLDVLTALRSTAESGTEVLRGTAEGGWRSSSMNLGCIVSSISAWEADADVRRWLVIEPSQDPDWQSPSVTVSQLWQEQGLDLREMRRSILLAFQDNYKELQMLYEELLYGSLEGDEAISPSQRDNVLPILTVCKMLDGEFPKVSRQFFLDKGRYEILAQQTRIEQRLVNAIVYTPFELERNNVETLLTFAEYQDVPNADLAKCGVALITEKIFKEGEPAMRQILLINFGNAQKAGPLKGTEFQHESGKSLANAISNHPAFIESSQSRRIGGVNVRWVRLDWDRLMMQQETGEVFDG